VIRTIGPWIALLLMTPLLVGTPGCRKPGGADAAASTPTPTGDVHADAAAFFATQPEYFRPLAHTGVPEGLQAMDAATCGGCHQDQLAEWRDSIHARAWDDDQYQAELKKDPAIHWICINCHLPLYDQQAQLPVGIEDGDLRRARLVDNPGYDETLRDDAIGCAACHVREGWVEGPTGESPGSPHPTRKSPDLTTSGFCTRCHGVEVTVEQLDLVCAFATGREWEAWNAAQPEGQGKTCQGCHMPVIEHRRWVGSAPAPGQAHSFPGSLIPKRESDREAFARWQEVFPEGVTATVAFDPPSPAPGSQAHAVITVTNANAGHAVPTGDPERYLEVAMAVRDDAGAALAERTEVIRVKFRWHPPPPVQEYDNRLTPGEARAFRVPFQVPASGAATATVAVDKYRIDEEALAYHDLEGVVVPGRPSVRAEVSLP